MEDNRLIKYENGQLIKIGNAIAVTNKLLSEWVIQFKGILIFEILMDSKGLDKVIALPNNQILTFSKFGRICLWDYRNNTTLLEINLETEINDSEWKILQGGTSYAFIPKKNIITAVIRYYLDCVDSEYGGPEKYIIYWIDFATFKIVKKEIIKHSIYSLTLSTKEKYLVGRTNNGLLFFNTDTFTIEKKIELSVNNEVYIDDDLNCIITRYSDSYPFDKHIKIWKQEPLELLSEFEGFKTGSISAYTYCGLKKVLAIFSSGEKSIKIFNLENYALLKIIILEIEDSYIPTGLKYSNDGNLLMVRVRHNVVVFETKLYSKINNLTHLNKSKTIPAKDGYIDDFAFSTDNQNIFTVLSDGFLNVWK